MDGVSEVSICSNKYWMKATGVGISFWMENALTNSTLCEWVISVPIDIDQLECDIPTKWYAA
jgi:hypothetical protein